MTTKTNVVTLSQGQTARRVNRLAALNREIKALQEEADALKAEFKAAGEGTYESAEHTVVVSTNERLSLDTGAVKAILTPTQIAACSKVTVVTTVSVK